MAGQFVAVGIYGKGCYGNIVVTNRPWLSLQLVKWDKSLPLSVGVQQLLGWG